MIKKFKLEISSNICKLKSIEEIFHQWCLEDIHILKVDNEKNLLKIYILNDLNEYSLENIFIFIDDEILSKNMEELKKLIIISEYKITWILFKVDYFFENIHKHNISEAKKLSFFQVNKQENLLWDKNKFNNYWMELLVEKSIDYKHFLNNTELINYFKLLCKKLKILRNKIYEDNFEFLLKNKKNINDLNLYDLNKEENKILFKILSSIPGFQNNIILIKNFESIHNLMSYYNKKNELKKFFQNKSKLFKRFYKFFFSFDDDLKLI